VRFGLFYEHQLPRPWSGDSEHRLLAEALAQVELADDLGFDFLWEVEHHFLEEYSHSSAPEVFLAAASQRTSRIRLGHGIVQLPPGFNQPARIAERVATLDLVSNGRVELGTGEASSEMELLGFGVDRSTKRQQWEEALHVVVRMLTEAPFTGHRGEHVQVPPRNVVPKPLQRPHPPLWVACSRPETILLAARHGIGALSFSFAEPSEARQWVEDYEAILCSEECVPAGLEVNARLACVLPLMCHRDEETAIAQGLDGCHFFGYSLGHYYVYGSHRPGRTDLWQDFERNRSRFGFDRRIAARTGSQLGARLVEEGLGSLRGAIGTPDQVRELVRRYEEAGVDQLIFVSQAGRNRHEDICASLELFAAEVMPEFARRAAELEAGKEERLRPAGLTALGRRPPVPALPDDYSVPSAASP
jgi:alkanesulfonate monooxygenase SsuD/methylene tetrahydromethanopterin reductase-like flavin-dependent oxidoreductase (luciferase family)